MTKTNSEAKAHAESRHPTSTFAVCFPNQPDPNAVTAVSTAPPTASSSSNAESKPSSAAPSAMKKKKAKEDLSFLDASLNPKASGKK